uniref:Reverse transcriptase domain-containing protein n=1 Tax=Nicotiana tabacum TaxID=4097 RepID=A0A1S3XG13_TOBAC|nr:PREDICTED: uncharacterized protein LOC107764743 [Nicotiana tabacum]
MSSTQNAPIHEDEGFGEKSGIGVGVPPINPEGLSNVEPVDISSHNALNTYAGTDSTRIAHREDRAGGQETRGMEEGGVSLQVIFEMPQAQQVALAQLQNSFVKEHAGAIKVATRKPDIFKIKQREKEILKEFVSHFQSERMELPPVFADWPYQSKIRVVDDQLGAPSGSVHSNRFAAKPSRDSDQGLRFKKERYKPYIKDRRNISRRNTPRNDRRVDRGQNARGLMSKIGFDRFSKPMEAPKLSEYNFIVDALGIVSAIGKVKYTRCPKPIQTDPSQRNPNLICKYHGTHGHRTKDCRKFREEVARLFNKGHFREFLSD